MLPHVKAVSLLGHAAQGQTLPLIVECLAKGRPGTVQIKVASRRNGLRARELACEALCTLLAGSVGLHVSAPAWVSLGDEVLTAIEMRYAMDVTDSVGAGVRWINYLRPLVVPEDIASRRRGKEVLNPLIQPLAGRALALDLLLCNSDRTMANPNLAWDGESLLVFDFEHCLELPGADFDRMLGVHLSLLPNLRVSHIFGQSVLAETLRQELHFCLDRLLVEAAANVESSGVPAPWRGAWREMLGYMEHLARNRDVIIGAAVADI